MNILDEIKLQIAQLNRWTQLYDKGIPEVSDKEWDDHYFKLAKLEKESGIYLPNSPTQRVIYKEVSGLNKVKHNHEMKSLDKTKDWDEFLNYFVSINPSKDVMGMLKLDGLTCSLRYLDGKLVSAETRGDGVIGEDILHNALVIKTIPKRIQYKEELIVDGEIICTYKDFEKFKTEYKNPRNFAAGSIRLLDPKECQKRDLTFVAWHVVKGLTNSAYSNLNLLHSFGFEITPKTTSFDWDAKDWLKDQAEKLGYPIDGLVGRFDDIKFGESLGSTEHHPKSAFAFKFYDEEYETTLKGVTYGVGRTGLLTPVAIFESVDADGSVIEKASLHNLSVARATLHGSGWAGQKIKVVKQNSIIPQVSWAEEDDGSAKTYIIEPYACPICGEPAEIRDNDGVVTAWCVNPHCSGKIINRLDYYCGKKGMDIKGLSKATLEKLIDWGWVKNINDIYSLSEYKSEWVRKPGFGSKSVENILNAIEQSKHCTLSKLISSFGITEIGAKVSKDLEKTFKTYRAFRDAVDDKDFQFSSLPNFGIVMNQSLKNFSYDEMDTIAELLYIEEVNENAVGGLESLNGLTFVVTGKLKEFKNRNELKAVIEANGGKVTGSVSSKTSYLINNDVESNTSKNKTAKELGIPIITENEFKEMLLNN